MSAFVCSDKRIATIAVYIAASFNKDNPRFSQSLADTLKRINIESVNYRYKESAHIDKEEVTPCNMGNIDKSYLNRGAVHKLIDCWLYQSCEDENNAEFIVWQAILKKWQRDYPASQYPDLWAI